MNFVLYRAVQVGSLYFILISYVMYYNEMLYSEWQSNAQENVVDHSVVYVQFEYMLATTLFYTNNWMYTKNWI